MISLKRTLTQILRQIKNLIDMDTPASSYLTADDGITAAIWQVRLSKYGGFCILQFNANITSTLTKSAETTVTTLPTDARPASLTYAVISPQNAPDQTILITLNTDGTISANPRIRNHSSSDGFIRFSVAYPIAYRGTT